MEQDSLVINAVWPQINLSLEVVVLVPLVVLAALLLPMPWWFKLLCSVLLVWMFASQRKQIVWDGENIRFKLGLLINRQMNIMEVKQLKYSYINLPFSYSRQSLSLPHPVPGLIIEGINFREEVQLYKYDPQMIDLLVKKLVDKNPKIEVIEESDHIRQEAYLMWEKRNSIN